MPIPFVDTPPTLAEVQRFRLILSTYQDGTGQLAASNNLTLPGWRDFERSVALAFGGVAQESKAIFDVLLPDQTRKGINYGISCKMRRTLTDTDRTGRVTLELSNSSGKFWDALGEYGLNQKNYKKNPQQVANALIALVEKWHHDVSLERDGAIDLTKSLYLALSWNKAGWYQLFQFPIALPNPNKLRWSFPTRKQKGKMMVGRRLKGEDKLGTLFEWYGESGGQLKYYPLVEKAVWKSERFQLEPLPSDQDLHYGILSKAAMYYPRLWETCKP